MILAGDVGGTNFRLALFERRSKGLCPVWRATYPSREADWIEILRRARREIGARSVSAASLAVAGPVDKGEAHLTNLGWHIHAQALASELGLAHAGVLNDLEAGAYGLLELAPADLATLQEGVDSAAGNKVLCSPGTGLGEAALILDGQRFLPVASEGGHASFSPHSVEDLEFARHLMERHGHASWERVLSGPGLVNVYEFLRDKGDGVEPDWLAHELASGDRGATITRAAKERACPLAVRTLACFARLLGVEASNLALKFLARGGVYLGGGIPVQIRTFLEREDFLAGFLAKGRMRALLERIPVHIVLNPDCSLLGAARHACLGASPESA